MNRIVKVVLSALILCLIPLSIISAQNKKSEQKIKIVTDDGSGTKVVIDTLIKGDNLIDSIRLKDGKVIFIHHPGSEAEMNIRGGSDHVFVTVSDDGKESKEMVKTITIVSSDSSALKETLKGDNVYIYNNSNETDAKTRYSAGKTSYVIAKDGMVVTVESNDEAKAKELISEIEKILDIKSEGSDKKETVKVETKKTLKK